MTMASTITIACISALGTVFLGNRILWSDQELSEKLWKLLGVSVVIGAVVFGLTYFIGIR